MSKLQLKVFKNNDDWRGQVKTSFKLTNAQIIIPPDPGSELTANTAFHSSVAELKFTYPGKFYIKY